MPSLFLRSCKGRIFHKNRFILLLPELFFYISHWIFPLDPGRDCEGEEKETAAGKEGTMLSRGGRRASDV